jgi:hypothetical protein
VVVIVVAVVVVDMVVVAVVVDLINDVSLITFPNLCLYSSGKGMCPHDVSASACLCPHGPLSCQATLQ